MKGQGRISRGLIGSTIGQILPRGKNKHGGQHREKVAMQQFSSSRISYILLESVLMHGNINRYQHECTDPDKFLCGGRCQAQGVPCDESPKGCPTTQCALKRLGAPLGIHHKEKGIFLCGLKRQVAGGVGRSGQGKKNVSCGARPGHYPTHKISSWIQ